MPNSYSFDAKLDENISTMEKFAFTSDQNDVKLLLHRKPNSLPNLVRPDNKGIIFKTFENLVHKWRHLPWKTLMPEKITEKDAFANAGDEKKILSISERILVPQAVIDRLLEQLKVFEKEMGYLDKDIDLPSLAKMLGTNHSYLSRVVNQVKGKSFKQYLNDMRIEYAYIDLQTNPIKRRYTVEAIAFDNGFRSAESFAKKFKARYGLYPSVFLKKLTEAA